MPPKSETEPLISHELSSLLAAALKPPVSELEAVDSAASLQKLFEVVDERAVIQNRVTVGNVTRSGVRPGEKESSRMREFPGGWAPYAAAVICSIIGLVLWQDIKPATVVEKARAIYTTRTGQHARIVFSDGSTAQLAPGSRLSMEFTSSERNIVLAGEALFSVNASSKAPFTVRSGNTVTRVLGTSFGVRHYPEDNAVRVVVAEGRVAVQGTVLSIGDVAEADVNGVVRVRHESNIAELLAWTSGRLAIRDMPMDKVVPIMERLTGC